MPYIQQPPSVQMGLVPVTLANGQVVEVPKAFMDRLRFDLDVSNQTTLHGRGRELDQSFKPAPQGQHVAYAGLDEYLNQLKGVYGGQGQAVQYSKPYQQQQKLIQQQQQQRDALGNSGATRQVSMLATGEVTSDTGQMVRDDQIRQYQPAIGREERKMRGAMMGDLQKLQKMGQSSTISNLPITVTRSNDPDVRGSMANHLSKLGQLSQTA